MRKKGNCDLQAVSDMEGRQERGGDISVYVDLCPAMSASTVKSTFYSCYIISRQVTIARTSLYVHDSSSALTGAAGSS